MDREQPRRPTSADVAREAGLSRATVSYVLNPAPHRPISEPTRRLVLEAAERLNYTPSAEARALRSGRSDLVLCLLPEWPLTPEAGALLENMAIALGARGLTLVAHPRARSPRPVAEVWKALRPAVVISFEPFSDVDREGIRAAGIRHAVELFSASSQENVAMAVNEERKGRLQVEHLAATGHRRLGYALTDDQLLQAFVQPRLHGVQQACAELGLDAPITAVVPLDPRLAAAAIRSWRGAEPAVTGVCAFNDEVAIAVLAGARSVGLAVPEDLAVVGVDDIPTALIATPSLTTVKTDQLRFASYFAKVILARLKDEPDPPRPGSDILSVLRRESA